MMKTYSTPLPQIESRETSRGIRFFVKFVPEFEGCQTYGFKSRESLMKAWVWWYNNAFLNNKSVKQAGKEWENGGKDEFYKKPIKSISEDVQKFKLKNDIKPKSVDQYYQPNLDVEDKNIPSWLD